MFTNDYHFKVNATTALPKAKSAGKSVSYNAAQQKLTITDDQITDTGFVPDPMLGADVNVPELSLLGILPGGNFAFQPTSSDLFRISSGGDAFMEAHIVMLTYLASSNTFLGELTNFSFSTSLGSPWAETAAEVFDPQSGSFDPARKLFFSYIPDNNFLTATQSFSVDGTSSGTNGIEAIVAEPTTMLLFGIGLAGLLACSRRARREHAIGRVTPVVAGSPG